MKPGDRCSCVIASEKWWICSRCGERACDACRNAHPLLAPASKCVTMQTPT